MCVCVFVRGVALSCVIFAFLTAPKLLHVCHGNAGEKALNLTPASPFETRMIRSWCLALRGIQLHKLGRKGLNFQVFKMDCLERRK